MNGNKPPGFFIVFPGRPIGIVLSFIDSAGCNPVHNHLYHILERHFIANQPRFLIFGNINPIFKMVFIASLMMQPCLRKSHNLPFSRIGASGSLIEIHSGPEFFRTVFRQIVKQSLTVQSYLKAVFHNQKLMLCDCIKMPYNI